MRKIEVSVYKFEELDADVQKSVLDKFRDPEHEWWDCIYAEWKTILEGWGFIDPQINFSGFYSQGDGACFTCGHVDLDKLLDKYLEDHHVPHVKWFRGYLIHCSIELRHRGNYSHEYSVELCDINYCYGYKRQNKLFEDFVAWVESKRVMLCGQIYSQLQEEYEYITSDAHVMELIEIDDYEFYGDGRLVIN